MGDRTDRLSYDWIAAKRILQADENLFSHILDKKTKEASGRKKWKNKRQSKISFVRMETPADYNYSSPRVIKIHGKGFESRNKNMTGEESLKFEDTYSESELEEMGALRGKIDRILEYWKVRPSLFWSSNVRTLEEIEKLKLSREEAHQLEYEVQKVNTLEKAIDEGNLDELYDIVQEEERLNFRKKMESKRRKSTKWSLAKKFKYSEDETKELDKVLAHKSELMVSDDVPSTASWRPEPHDSLIDRYIYKRLNGTLVKNSKINWDNVYRNLGVFVTIAYMVLLTMESWWENFLEARANRAVVFGLFHFSKDNYLPYYYQECTEVLLKGLRICLVAASFLPVLAIAYPRTVHSLCFFVYGIQFLESFWETFQMTFMWFTESWNDHSVTWDILKLIFSFLIKYCLLACLIKFHYEMMKPWTHLREMTNRIQWRHNEEIWFKSFSNLRMRMMSMKWMQNFSKYHHWNKAKQNEPKETQAIWTDTEEFVRALEEPGLELADVFKSFRKEHRFHWMKVPGGWDELEIFQSDPSISTDSDMWVRGPGGGQVFRDSRKRTKRRKYRRKYRGYGGDYVDKHHTKIRRYKHQEKGLRALLNRHGPQHSFPENEEIDKRLYWFRERMLIAFKRAIYQKGGGVYGGAGFSYGCLGPCQYEEELPKYKVKRDNFKSDLNYNDG